MLECRVANLAKDVMIIQSNAKLKWLAITIVKIKMANRKMYLDTELFFIKRIGHPSSKSFMVLDKCLTGCQRTVNFA